MTSVTKKVRLPVLFRALDLELRTKQQGTVTCPVRNEPVTLGTCGQCDDFVGVEFDADSKALLCCAPRVFHPPCTRTHDPASMVQEMLRVPMLSVSQDTPLAAMTDYLDLQRPWQIIPVLDEAARPVGIISNEALRRELATGDGTVRTFESIMSRQFTRVHPWDSVADAADTLPETGFRGLVVVSADGTFLGLVTEYDLSNAA